jgi:hypothetical protein
MLATMWTVPLVNERHLKRLLTNYVNLLSRRSNTSRSEQGNSQCASASSDTRRSRPLVSSGWLSVHGMISTVGIGISWLGLVSQSDNTFKVPRMCEAAVGVSLFLNGWILIIYKE